jgi:hypothetical protein
MTEEEFAKLSEGDLVRHVNSSEAYTVMGNYMRFGVVLVRTALAHNPREWDLVAQARYTMQDE